MKHIIWIYDAEINETWIKMNLFAYPWVNSQKADNKLKKILVWNTCIFLTY